MTITLSSSVLPPRESREALKNDDSFVLLILGPQGWILGRIASEHHENIGGLHVRGASHAELRKTYQVDARHCQWPSIVLVSRRMAQPQIDNFLDQKTQRRQVGAKCAGCSYMYDRLLA